MPIGKVKWYDPERGFGFVSNPGDEDCFVGRQVLPEGVEELHQGQRIEFDFAAGRRGPQALRVKLLDAPRAARRTQHRYEPEQLHGMISDLVTFLEAKVQPDLRSGRRPDRKTGRQVAEILRAVARELDS
ncbi:cold-shock protein [Corynebacterium pygosceleis]|uniref:Cold-shock protein n=1 Tax=Corynebacterium pygosceleis TaxID=2800406 RepID=A0A9Q4GK79_9CORY|nr:cold-shock protein [Corynebacterium pygosceleis]MCK7638188.1 cold-shock protein [Corynebacterium pygosceleis]MCK7675901.1 cold-shock protein [Corynebacterium pygosceleis]MCL0120717.1 cold-shock protein [Corynebacterium pygosceleis]MCX7444257.1 cold-shock protein [Corynebacterium pygosceleis]MCX7468904.1 cold-shock protein [Corynebacterium pygosceleis]